MAISERARQITDQIYRAYGSDSGGLFGLRPDARSAVEAIVSTALEMAEKEADNEHRNEAQ